MPSIKLKLPGRNKSPADVKPEVTVPRKKHRIDSSDDERPESEGKNEGKDNSTQEQSDRRRRMSQNQAPEPDRLFDDDMDVDVVNGPGSDDIPDRAPTPSAGPSVPVPKRGKKKKTAVYSDEDDEFIDAGRKEDVGDDDFVVDSPPRKPVARKASVGGTKARGKGAKEKGGAIGEIMIKDERKLAPSSAAPVADAKAGAKRRRETISELKTETKMDIDSGGAIDIASQPLSSSTVGPSTSQPKESTATAPPPSKIRKLPPIKKNKALAGAMSSAPSAGPSTPSASSLAAKSNITAAGGATSMPTSDALPIHSFLPRKPLQKTSDLDLSSPDIYNSLFKSGSSAPRVGVNSRVKEEERRKELMKMRDEARAARLVQLQKNSFDLLAPQEKIARFELKLRERNSSAVYPNHLAASLKLFQLKKDAGQQQGLGPGPGGGG